jgi:hypothetical protein
VRPNCFVATCFQHRDLKLIMAAEHKGPRRIPPRRHERELPLNLEDTDLDRGTTWIKGKGRERELVPLPQPVIDAIRRYLRWCGGTCRGPLFLTRSGRISATGEHRLQARSVLRIVRTLDGCTSQGLDAGALR